MAEHKTLAEALAAFQAEVPKMSKDETAKVKSDKANYSYGYAGLDQFVEIVEPVLGKHGMAVTSKTTFADNLFMLEVSLVHESGERETAFWPLPDPRRVGPQDLGSAMTYGRRYLGWGLTGTFPGGIDDDGAKAQSSARESFDDARPRPAQQQEAAAQTPAATAKAPKTSWTDAEVFGIQEKMRAAPLDKAIGAYDWMADKGLHHRQVRNPEDAAETRRSATSILAARLADDALKPNISAGAVLALRNLADARGLLKTQVSETETLDQVIYEGLELAKHAAAAEASQDPGSQE